MSDDAFPAVPSVDLALLLANTEYVYETREVLKFLATIVAHIGQDNPLLNDAKFFFESQLSRYEPGSSIAINLTAFLQTGLLSFEAAVRQSLQELDFSTLSMAHDNPVLIQVKRWMVRCALQSTLGPTLQDKLSIFVEPQPTPLFVPAPEPVPPEVSGSDFPELARAMLALVDHAGDIGFEMDDAFHILREFMRLAMNCAQVWSKYGPKDWNFEVDGMPEMSEEARHVGLVAVGDAWRRMIENPFSDAPLHVRRLLAECDIIAAAKYFLVDVHRSLRSPFPSLINIQRLAQHFVLHVQGAAEDINYEYFHRFRVTRLGNPFLTPSLPAEAFAPRPEELHTRQSLDMVWGLPFPDSMDLPGGNETVNLFSTAEQIPSHEALIATFANPFFGLDQGDDHDPDLWNIDDDAQQPLMDVDAPVYAGEFALAITPELVAVGPVTNPLQFCDQVDAQKLQNEDECLICQVPLIGNVELTKPSVRLRACGHMMHLEDFDNLVNGAYWQQPRVRCPGCRSDICASRETRQVAAQQALPIEEESVDE